MKSIINNLKFKKISYLTYNIYGYKIDILIYKVQKE